jgi:predicted ATPase/class 3 adenylate cyclase
VPLVGEQPTGTVTMLFTDIEGSTRLLERLGPDRYRESLDLHRSLLRDAFMRHHGYEVDYEGDAFFVAFADATDAVAAAAESQQALAAADWSDGLPIRVRMGVHTGEPLAAPPKYVGLDVHKAARIMAAGHGGQVLVSAATQRLLDRKFEVASLGEHRLKDLSQAEPLYQLQVVGLPSEFPALKTLGNRPNNLPVVATPFVGREDDLEDVRALLLWRDVRLLTLTGPGGIGKTRLALQTAAEVLDSFPSGVFWVPLAPVRDTALVVPTIAQALGVREEAGEPISATLTRYLAEKQLLLVLDNFEHLIDAATEVAAILAAAPNVRVLSTSREALRLQGEQLFDVPPLSLPAADDLASVETVDAVQLFLARARAVDPSFAVAEDNAAVIAEIVRRLDGIPLALELAAARVRELPPQALLRRLDSRLRILTGGSRDSDERQRTLRATVEWSYDLLSLEEQTLFARLSVFVGGCRLEAAEAVCNYDRTLPMSVFDGIASLVQKSLLRRRTDPDGEPRYWILETIREYAVELLASHALAPQLAERQAAWFLQVGSGAGAAVFGEDEVEVHRLLAADDENLREALCWYETHGTPTELARLASSLAHFWRMSGRFSESLSWLQTALLTTQGDATPERLNTLKYAFWLAIELGDPIAHAYAEERLALARSFADAKEVAGAVSSAAMSALVRGESERAVSLQREAVAMLRGGDDDRLLATAIGNLANHAYSADELDTAQAASEEACRLWQKLGNERHYWSVYQVEASVALRRGNPCRALAMFSESVPKLYAHDHPLEVALGLMRAARALARADPARAVRFLAVSARERAVFGAVPEPGEQRDEEECLALLRSLFPDGFDAAWEAGTQQSLAQTVSELREVRAVETTPS